jgi:glutamyl-tRNA reductase
MTLFAFGINHKAAPVEIREKLYLRDDEITLFLRRLKVSLAESLVLSTCNRTRRRRSSRPVLFPLRIRTKIWTERSKRAAFR